VTNPNLIAILPADTELNKFTDTMIGFYAENKIQWTEKFRSVLTIRGDEAIYNVTSLTPEYVASELPGNPVISFARLNSGSAAKFLPSPKASLILGPWRQTEFYIQGGFGFHSNDARGATQHVQPISPDNPFPTPSTPIAPLVATKGGEVGVRTTAIPHLQSTVSLWYLHSNSELQQDGDTGGTVASQQPSNRYGVEWANFYTPTDHLAFDFDFADSRARFTEIDPDDAAYTNPGGGLYPVPGPGGFRVPEAVGLVTSSGITLHDYKGFSASLRLRYFGPRDLTSDGIYHSDSTALLNAQVGYQFNRSWRLSTEFLNLLNRRDHDIDYAYISRITPTGDAAFTDVFHPTEPFQLRVSLQFRFE
jgi:outer membrane receptor protein involved in Fe transport